MFFALILGVDEDVIEVHYDKNIELLYQNLVDVALECDRCVSQSKRYYLVLEMAIASLEGRLLFVAFPDSHSMVNIGQVELGEPSGPA